MFPFEIFHKFLILFANLKNVRELQKMFLFSNIVLKFENVQFLKKIEIQFFGGRGFYKIFDFSKKNLPIFKICSQIPKYLCV